MIVLWLGLCSALAYYLFAQGFLSTRLELPQRTPPYHLGTNESPPATFDRAVILIVDALRVDFVFPAAGGGTPSPMPDLHAMLEESGPTSLALRFIADVPTITMSRVKALLTGGLPTFIDIGSSFSASAVNEDNLLIQSAQDSRGPRRVAFMGDDTWMQLAPHSDSPHNDPQAFTFALGMCHPYPSFDTVDLHTVDRGVWSNLEPYLKETYRWDMLVAHFLGVDHAGHSHGAESKEMADKLKEIDGWIKKTADAMIEQSGPGQEYERSILIVLGDHGMTRGGDHGGGSREETDSLLMAFNIGAWRRRRGHPDEKHSPTGRSCPQVEAEADQRFRVLTAFDSHNSSEEGILCGSMPQVDFPPSISVALGLPIPFSSIGRVDPSWYHMMMQPREGVAQTEWRKDMMGAYLRALRLNAKQVQRYFSAYSDYARIKAHADLVRVAELYREIEMRFNESSHDDPSPTRDEDFARGYLHFLGVAASVARYRFLRYDLRLMVCGCALMTLSVIGYVWAALKLLASASRIDLKMVKPSLLASFLVLAMALCQGLSLFGVTWIMAEGKVQCRLLLLMIIAIWAGAIGDLFLMTPSQPSCITKSRASLLTLAASGPLAFISIVMMQGGLLDRSGQDPHDKSQPMAMKDLLESLQEVGDISSGVSSLWALCSSQGRLILPLMAAPLWFGACHFGLELLEESSVRKIYFFQSLALPWPLAMALYLAQQAISIGFWLVQALGDEKLSLNNLSGLELSSVWLQMPLRLLLPRLVYMLTLTNLALGAASVLSSFGSGSAKSWRKHLWLVASCSSSVTMLLGKNGPLCILLGSISASCILFICITQARTDPSSSFPHSLGISLPVCWSVLSIVLFFTSGHFCEFSGLQYTSPFIGFDSVSVTSADGEAQEGSFWISGAMLSINTFGPQLLLGLALPLASQSSPIDPRLPVVVFCLIRNLNACISMICTAILRRNVVIWAILAPKLVFEMFFAAIAIVSAALGLALSL